MSNVKVKDIPFNERYVNIRLDYKIIPGTITVNLRNLYEFIDKYEGKGGNGNFGNAFRVILKKARNIASNRKYIISKKQVASLIRISEKRGENISLEQFSKFLKDIKKISL